MAKPLAHLTIVVFGLVTVACAQNVAAQAQAQDQGQGASAPIPPGAEAAPQPRADGTFCYGGPHPVDTRVAAGPPWDDAHGPHTHTYAPFDVRLFSFKDGCYHFVGDPQDFGYRGPVYSYYGAHPVLDVYGGGWCFLIGGHSHWWQPWSAHFTVVGPWYYWQGPYDPFFWSYYPYYSFYYGAYYPRYYGAGRFYRGGDRLVAPGIRNVPPAYAANRARPVAPSGAVPPSSSAPGGWRSAPPMGAPETGSAGAYAPGGGWGASPYGAGRAYGGGFSGGHSRGAPSMGANPRAMGERFGRGAMPSAPRGGGGGPARGGFRR